ncbi:hypothetical protein FHY29_003623 [Xanthomonas arboricola]|uniref:hypothetical protein n=1 Tax=Xanthomonas arboricola TaxID=56448 RepID=UPI000CEDE7A1|nr:hypothetical protein [Xanthomonas arboricola]PPU52014.1 hypothetical protein XarbCFBP6827_10770 [Xanthomonas arboricola]
MLKPTFNQEQYWFRIRQQELVRVRTFAAPGRYPHGEIVLPDGFFHADAEAAILVTRGFSWNHYFEGSGFDEFGWPFPSETRFMGAMLLCEKQDGPVVSFYPHHEPALLLDPATVDLADPKCRTAIVELVKDVSAWPVDVRAREFYKQRAQDTLDLFLATELELSRLEATWAGTSLKNFVLLRGISSIVKSDMLSRHREFGAEALMSLYVALECSFQLVLEYLREKGFAAPSASDAARWMHETFEVHFGLDPPDPSYKYFQEFYEDRIVTFHPRNRFGDFPLLPTYWDDVFHLRRAIPPVFSFLIHGEHSPSFLDAINEFRARRPGA